MAAGSLPRVVFVLGPPGSGKGTICALLSKVFPYAHLSAGSLLRASRCEAVQRSLRNGDIVSSHITIDILTEEMRSLGAWGGSPHPRVSVSPCLRGFLLDGFPRNLENAWSWELDVGRCTETRFVLSLECSAKESLSRCLSRSLGSSARSDDEVDIITKRLALFERESRPVLDTFHERGLLKRVDSSQPTVEFGEVQTIKCVTMNTPSMQHSDCCCDPHSTYCCLLGLVLKTSNSTILCLVSLQMSRGSLKRRDDVIASLVCEPLLRWLSPRLWVLLPAIKLGFQV
ncbi:unnamed protein product [Lampetra fluviatilis]